MPATRSVDRRRCTAMLLLLLTGARTFGREAAPTRVAPAKPRDAAAAGERGKRDARHAHRGEIAFICRHGSIKSVIAAAWFNRRAAERGIAAHAAAYGAAPDDAVPAFVVAGLAAEGIDVAGSVPQGLTQAVLDGAAYHVLIDVPAVRHARTREVPTASWQDIPSATEDYAAASAALRARVEALLDALPDAP